MNATSIILHKPPGNDSLSPYSTLQAHTLLELDRLIRKKKEYEAQPDKNLLFMKVLQRAVYAAYRDCQECGVGDFAREMLFAGKKSSLNDEQETSAQI